MTSYYSFTSPPPGSPKAWDIAMMWPHFASIRLWCTPRLNAMWTSWEVSAKGGWRLGDLGDLGPYGPTGVVWGWHAWTNSMATLPIKPTKNSRPHLFLIRSISFDFHGFPHPARNFRHKNLVRASPHLTSALGPKDKGVASQHAHAGLSTDHDFHELLWRESCNHNLLISFVSWELSYWQ